MGYPEAAADTLHTRSMQRLGLNVLTCGPMVHY
jgi:hypothetical protein